MSCCHHHSLSALCLLAAVVAAVASVSAASGGGGYEAYLDAMAQRNRQLHSDYLTNLAEGQSSFLDQLDGHVSDLQAKHYVRDSAYPAGFDPERYWQDLMARTAAASASDDTPMEPRQTRAMDSQKSPVNGNNFASMADLLLAGTAPAERREEEPFLNRIWGDHKVSGGAGKPGQVTGPDNKPQKVKIISDRLPSYCDPPNPCPLHADPSKLTSPCEKTVQDTAEYNYAETMRKIAAGDCLCDDEHMECPAGSATVSSSKKTPTRMSTRDNPYLHGSKRDKHDAKKSPKFSVQKRGAHANFQSTVVEKKNPWLDGAARLDTVEKKAGRHAYLEE